APWRALFLSHITSLPSPEFVLSTLERVPPQPSVLAPSSTAASYRPRARTCIYRGLWAELPANEKNAVARNPGVYESECPTLTTDVRMEKVGQVFGTAGGGGEGPATEEEVRKKMEGSGGGGPVEAVWWVPDVATQWRVRGRAYVVGPDIEGEARSEGAEMVRSVVGRRMRVVGDEARAGEWSWQREVDGHFGNMSPAIRGSFKAPPPGRPVNEPYDDKHLELGEPVDDVDDAIARKHFRVVVIIPDEVEQLDLSDPKTSRRYLYSYLGDQTGGWKMEEEWP
ncbi:pyridoxamine 5'-phosphate oxidase-domain-containing protein, partial [Lineolata rhizophorae]